ncbi:MAG TPA: transcriptional regulator, partial [Actinomycetota bacterium]|nr:transcriptional regulator [Actinomycetota bacterium]
VLEKAGLIARGREAQWRPCRLEADPLKEVADWVEGYRRFWERSEERYRRLDDYLRQAQAAQPTERTERKEEPDDQQAP